MKYPRIKLARGMYIIGEYQVEKDEGMGTWDVARRDADRPAPVREFDNYQDAKGYAEAMSELGRLSDKYGFRVQRGIHI